MKYKCKICGFIHEGEMPDGYFCPLCFSQSHEFDLIKKKALKYNRVYVNEESKSHARIEDLCINCGACSNTCFNIVNIKYKEDNKPICINCGQCILTCPTGSLIPKYNYNDVIKLLEDPSKTVVAITSPEVNVSIGDAFNYPLGENLKGKMITALKELGFNYVYDASFASDLISIKTAQEIKNNNKPIFSSTCPSWLEYAKIYHQDLIPYISKSKSPINVLATLIKNIFAAEFNIKKEDLLIVAITPCTSRKIEIINSDCDYALTTSELALAIRENNIKFNNLKNSNYDHIKASSLGTLYTTSGGAALSILKVHYYNETGENLEDDLILIKDYQHYKEYSVKINDKIIKTASLYQMKNLEKILPTKEEYLFIEVMNCKLGCIGGGGQVLTPLNKHQEVLKQRKKTLIKEASKIKLKYPYYNEEVLSINEEYNFSN